MRRLRESRAARFEASRYMLGPCDMSRLALRHGDSEHRAAQAEADTRLRVELCGAVELWSRDIVKLGGRACGSAAWTGARARACGRAACACMGAPTSSASWSRTRSAAVRLETRARAHSTNKNKKYFFHMNIVYEYS